MFGLGPWEGHRVETTGRPVPVYLPLEMHGWGGIEIVRRGMDPLLKEPGALRRSL
ncbi:MAG: hypothetical protein H0X71_02810 [Rubrobacter sp.]|nr:hypothetical protein [Rubrobacter sp.]